MGDETPLGYWLRAVAFSAQCNDSQSRRLRTIVALVELRQTRGDLTTKGIDEVLSHGRCLGDEGLRQFNPMSLIPHQRSTIEAERDRLRAYADHLEEEAKGL